MREIHLNKTKDCQIGNVRVSPELFKRIASVAKQKGVSNQDIVRAILENFIDEVIFK